MSEKKPTEFESGKSNIRPMETISFSKLDVSKKDQDLFLEEIRYAGEISALEDTENKKLCVQRLLTLINHLYGKIRDFEELRDSRPGAFSEVSFFEYKMVKYIETLKTLDVDNNQGEKDFNEIYAEFSIFTDNLFSKNNEISGIR